jgi:hypothetical protein
MPGRAESANPESGKGLRARVWIPGPALTRRPGMTDKVSIEAQDAQQRDLNFSNQRRRDVTLIATVRAHVG